MLVRESKRDDRGTILAKKALSNTYDFDQKYNIEIERSICILELTVPKPLM